MKRGPFRVRFVVAGNSTVAALAVIMLSLFSGQDAWAVRGRPVINSAGTTFVTDRGSLLRGPQITIEKGRLPSRNDLRAIKNYGCNALHCYVECASAGLPVGVRASILDTLVQWTREDDLYLIITIGNCEAPIDAEFNAAFWKFYAGRYANEKHVIYEIQNEPVKYPGVSVDITGMERKAYAIIRSQAPVTPVLFFSYMAFQNGPAVIRDIKSLGSDVDWQHAAVAFHGYGEGGRNACRACLEYVLKAGYPCFQTEFHSPPWGVGIKNVFASDAWYQDADETGDFERLGVSWLSFLSLRQIQDDQRFKQPLTRAGITWKPDFGAWPGSDRNTHGNHGEPWTATNLTDTLHIEAENFDDGGAGMAWNDTTPGNAFGNYRTNCNVDIEPTSDTGGGFDIGQITEGEWLEYTCQINNPGLYQIKLRVESILATNRLSVLFDGINATNNEVCFSGDTDGNPAWQTITNTVFLRPGQQIMRLQMLGSGFKINWVELTPVKTGALTNKGIFKITNRYSGKALTVSGARTGNGAKIVQSTFSHQQSQEWVVTHLGADEYTLSCLQTGRLMDVKEHSRDNGAGVEVWSNGNTANQRWILTPAGDGFFMIRAAHSGLALDIRQKSKADDVSICQRTCVEEPNQQWSFEAP